MHGQCQSMENTQYVTTDDSPFLDEHITKRVQAILCTFIYYACAVDPCQHSMKFPTSRPKKTEKTAKTCRQHMHYLHTHPKAVVQSRSCPGQNHMCCSSLSLWSWDSQHIYWCPRSRPYDQHLSFGTPSRPTSPLPMTSSQPKFAWSILRRLTWYHWLKYRISQGKLNIFGEFGKQYCGKFFTKHHPLARH